MNAHIHVNVHTRDQRCVPRTLTARRSKINVLEKFIVLQFYPYFYLLLLFEKTLTPYNNLQLFLLLPTLPPSPLHDPNRCIGIK